MVAGNGQMIGQQMIVAGALLFEQLLGIFICFIKPVLVFSGRKATNFSHGFLYALKIVFQPCVTTLVYLQLLRLGTFSLGKRLEGKGNLAT